MMMESSIGMPGQDQSIVPNISDENTIVNENNLLPATQLLSPLAGDLDVSSSRIINGLVALYDFGEGEGNTVFDKSSAGEQLDLTINDADKVTWGDGVLSVTSDTQITSFKPATKLFDALSKTNEITIEAWITPQNSNQSGPARILSLSSDTQNRNFTLGQAGKKYDVRLRTTQTNNNGTAASLSSSGGQATNQPTQVIYTRESDGDASLYINNQLIASEKVEGDFSNWDGSYAFSLANEMTGDRPWLGTYDLVAVYDQSFDAKEVNQNFLAGSDLIHAADQPILLKSETNNFASSASTNSARTTLQAGGKIVDGSVRPQIWGDGVTLSAFDLDGNPAAVTYDTQFKDEGFGVAGGRWKQIDFYAEGGNRSERLEIDFGGLVSDVVVTVGMMGLNEGRNDNDETGKWTAFDANGNQIAEGLLGPDQSLLGKDVKIANSYGKYPISINASEPIAKIVIEATGFGNGNGQPRQTSYGENNSDFNIAELSYRRDTNTPTTEGPSRPHTMGNSNPPEPQGPNPPATPDTPNPPTTDAPKTPTPTDNPIPPTTGGPNTPTTPDNPNPPTTDGSNTPTSPDNPIPPTTGGPNAPTPPEPASPPTTGNPNIPSTPNNPSPPTTGGPNPPTPTNNPNSSASEPITLKASRKFLDGSADPQTWGDGVTVSGLATNGSPQAVAYIWGGLTVTGGRYDGQIDFDPTSGESEKLVLDFNGPVSQAEVELGRMEAREWKGLAETGRWTAYDANGGQVATGILDPTNAVSMGRSNYRFTIDSPEAFDRLVIEATAYGNGAGGDRTSNNSDFNLRSLTYTRAVSNDDTGGEGSTDSPGAGDQGSGNPNTDNSAPGGDPTDSNSSGGSSTPNSGSPTDNDPTGNSNPDVGNGDNNQTGGGNSAGGDSIPDSPPLPNGVTLWSQLNPTAGKQVLIAKGETVLLDTDTANLSGVIVEGKLVFSETFLDANGNGELDFTADWILVRNGGHLEIGTEENPYEANATITLDGADEDVMNMGMGGRFIIAAGTSDTGVESTISMHGIDGEKVSWTQLAATVDRGSKAITLAETVNWEVGDEIVIAPSGFDANEAEKRTIIAVDGNKVTLDKALEYEHFGEIETTNGKSLDMRAEVGLLSRNIDIQGAADSLESEFGAHMMFMKGSSVEISGIEIRRGGQVGKKARYPIHWHLGGDHTGDYVKNSAIYDSFQRGIVVHGVDNVQVDSNVVYNVFSHAYVFSEDGNEFNNSFTNNLGLLIKERKQEDFSFFNTVFTGNSSQGEHRPAVFWGRNYFNPLVGNHAAGTTDGNGFHYDFRGMTFQNRQKFVNIDKAITFTGNVSHSNGTKMAILPNYSPIARGGGLMMERFGGKIDTEVAFEDFTTYKNDVFGVWMEDDRQVLRGAMIADTSTGVIVQQSTIEDTLIDQKTSNFVGGVLGVDRPILDATDLGGGIHVLLNQGGPTIRDVTFIDIDPAAITVHKNGKLGDGTTTISGSTLVNTSPIHWRSRKIPKNTLAGNITDLDGSLTGTGVPTVISGPAAAVDDKFFKADFNAYVTPARKENS